MRVVATWMRPKDAPFFARSLAPFPDLQIRNAMDGDVAVAEVDGLLLTGGADIRAEYLNQPVPDPSLLDTEADPHRDEWEVAATRAAQARQLPIFAICKGLQVLNVVLGGTLRLDISGHNAPEMKDHDVQPLRLDRAARHRFQMVNSSHHQAIDRLAEGCVVEAWCAEDDIIEQVRVADYPFALGVQYHPERGGGVYAPLFADFVKHLSRSA